MSHHESPADSARHGRKQASAIPQGIQRCGHDRHCAYRNCAGCIEFDGALKDVAHTGLPDGKSLRLAALNVLGVDLKGPETF
jgi:hypothetical protein